MSLDELTKQDLHNLVIAKYLSMGAGTGAGARAISKALGVPEREDEISAYMLSAEFNKAVFRAKKDMAASVVDAIKESLHKYRDKLDELALKASDPRVQFQALKDLMDRGGTGGTQKFSLTSPQAYRKAIEEFVEADEKGEEADAQMG